MTKMIIHIEDDSISRIVKWILSVTKKRDGKYHICSVDDSDLCAQGDTIDEALENFFEGEALFI